MLKTTFISTETKLLKYRCDKNFSLNIINDDLTENDFDHIFSCYLDKLTTRKKKWIRGNTKPRANKKLRSAIMKRFIKGL